MSYQTPQEQVISLIKSDQRVAALKMLRDLDEVSLAEAKRRLNVIERDLVTAGELPADYNPGGGDGALAAILIVPVVLFVIAAYLARFIFVG